MTTESNSDLDGARQVVVRALEKFNADQAGLLAFDGRPINAPELHQRELAKILEPVQWATDRAVALADKVTSALESQRLAPHADPTSALSAADLADANLRAQWIREDCETLPLDDLTERLRAVHAGGGRPAIWLHDRYAKQRWTRESDRVPQSPDLTGFAEVLRDLGIIGPKAGLSSEAQKRAEAAAQLKRWAGAQLQNAQTGKKPGTGSKINL